MTLRRLEQGIPDDEIAAALALDRRRPACRIAFAMQRGRTELLAPATITADVLRFEFPAWIAGTTSHPSRLAGGPRQGPPSETTGAIFR
jgi:hypothetical protein